MVIEPGEASMTSKEEVYSNKVGHLLLAAFIGFTLWQVTGIGRSVLREMDVHLSLSVRTIFAVVRLSSFVFWISSLAWMFGVLRKIKKDPDLSRTMKDEYYKHLVSKAFCIAFYAMLAAQVFIVMVSMFVYPLTGEMAADVTMLIAAVSVVSAMVYLDRD